ncbi:MAG: type IV-A pilus assembly ATPase PilB [Panacagrimonas sp.]
MSTLPQLPIPSPPPAFLGGLARRLVADGLITEERAREIQARALKTGLPIVSVLVQSQSLPANRLADAASQEFGVPLLDLNAFSLDRAVMDEVGEKLMRKCHAMPLFKRGRRLFLGVSDPTNLQALDEIKFATGMTTEAILVEEDKLAAAIEQAATQMESANLKVGTEEELANLEVVDTEFEARGEVTRSDADEAPIVKFVNKLMVDAINQGASDIHFEPYERVFRIRYRKDGELRIVATPAQQLAIRIAARVKVMSRLDLAERRVPQDGRIKLQISRNRAIDLRVSTCPTLWGEKIVCRILDPSTAQLGIDALGYDADQKSQYLDALKKPQGMIVVTGPTGSGKTVSLYTGLSILNTDNVNISTVEDPVEINLAGINQVNVNPRAGLTFAAALKAFLRQDPDVIMVGEIRDLETAEIAIKAAQTGHLVLSTLHTNDAPQTVARLINMGVPAYNLASTLTLIIAQRLARKLCPTCKKPADIPRQELLKEGFEPEDLDAPGFQLFRAVGCGECDRGYLGRTGIFEVMPFSEAMGRIIMEGGSAIDLADQARREGVRDLRTSALARVKSGVIDLLEANRVTLAE